MFHLLHVPFDWLPLLILIVSSPQEGALPVIVIVVVVVLLCLQLLSRPLAEIVHQLLQQLLFDRLPSFAVGARRLLLLPLSWLLFELLPFFVVDARRLLLLSWSKNANAAAAELRPLPLTWEN